MSPLFAFVAFFTGTAIFDTWRHLSKQLPFTPKVIKIMHWRAFLIGLTFAVLAWIFPYF